MDGSERAADERIVYPVNKLGRGSAIGEMANESEPKPDAKLAIGEPHEVSRIGCVDGSA